MFDYIKIGSWRSDTVIDLHVMDWDAPLLAPADYGSAQIPGRMTSLRDARLSLEPLLGISLGSGICILWDTLWLQSMA